MPLAWAPKQAQERAEGLHHRPTTRHGGFAPVRLGSALRLPEGDGHVGLRPNARCRDGGGRNGVVMAGKRYGANDGVVRCVSGVVDSGDPL